MTDTLTDAPAPEGGEPTYFRPVNAETGAPLLTVYFTSPLFTFEDSYLHDIEQKYLDLAADVRDHMHTVGIPIRPTIKDGRLQILQETDPDENGYNRKPEVFFTVMAFLTDAEPDDPRLEQLRTPFTGQRTGT